MKNKKTEDKDEDKRKKTGTVIIHVPRHPETWSMPPINHQKSNQNVNLLLFFTLEIIIKGIKQQNFRLLCTIVPEWADWIRMVITSFLVWPQNRTRSGPELAIQFCHTRILFLYFRLILLLTNHHHWMPPVPAASPMARVHHSADSCPLSDGNKPI